VGLIISGFFKATLPQWSMENQSIEDAKKPENSSNISYFCFEIKAILNHSG